MHGVLQEAQISDASIEGKLKKLLVRARELQSTQTAAKSPAAEQAASCVGRMAECG